MFDQLIESHVYRRRSRPQALLSIVVHIVVIAVSIRLTRAVATTTLPAPRPMDAIFTPPRQHTAAPAAATHAPPTTPDVAAPVAAPLVIAIPLATAVLTPDAPTTPDFSGRGHPSGTPSITAGDDTIGSADSLIVALDEADVQTRYLSGPQPQYPAALARSGISGWVQLRYIVGTSGRAEPGSMHVASSSRPEFVEPAVAAIEAAHFSPATVRGRVVRQVVEQTVRFTIP